MIAEYFFSSDKPIVDPTEIEELAVDGFMMVALNSYMEICCSKMCGIAISPEKVSTNLLLSKFSCYEI